MSVFATLEPLQGLLKIEKIKIDNNVFRLHYKATAIALLTFSLLITANQFIGDPIDCFTRVTINEDDKPDIPLKLLDTYCWIHSTHTIRRLIMDDNAANPGVGQALESDEPLHQRYYQWMCYMLFFQAWLFYAPRFLWKKFENKKISKIVTDDLVVISSDKKVPAFPKPRGILEEELKKSKAEDISRSFANKPSVGVLRVQAFNQYYYKFQICEWLNLVNVIFQIILLNIFFDGMFTTFGTDVFSISDKDATERSDPLNLVFPKVTKCTFHKSGPSGTTTLVDAICVLPLNILAEKIYIFMWFWFILLALLTAIHQTFRVATLISVTVRAKVLRRYTNTLLPETDAVRIANFTSKGEWFFLTQIGANVDAHLFTDILDNINSKIMKNHGLESEKITKND